MSVLQSAFALIFAGLVIVAALKDVTSFTIPNWISIALVLAFLPAALAAGVAPTEFGLHLAVGVVALLAGMGMFFAGWIGGGDAKLLAAAALWLGWRDAAPFLLITGVAGGVLAVTLMSLRSSAGRALAPSGPAWWEKLRSPEAAAPYGVAIAVGALATFPSSPLAAATAGLF